MAAGVSPFSSRAHRLRAPWPRLGLALALVVTGLAPLRGAQAQGPADPLAAADPLQAAILACQAAVQAGDPMAVRQVQNRLLPRPPQPEPMGPLLARAEALLACRAPAGALQVLDRISPAAGPQRQLWLLMRWQAAHAGLDHRLAADALWRLAAGDLASLQALPLPVAPTAQRPALDLLADHLEALGWPQRAAEVLLSGRGSDAAAAARLGRAAALAQALPLDQRQPLLERALELAAEAGAWGLVAQLLDQQVALGSSSGGDALAVQRRLRLSPRIDDAYGEWQLRPRPELEQQLRSPREPGGHAASPRPPATPRPSALP